MLLVPYDKNKLKKYRGFGKFKNLKLLEEFRDGESDCCEVKNFTQKDAKSCQTSLMASIRRYKFPNYIKVVVRKEKVYLVKFFDD